MSEDFPVLEIDFVGWLLKEADLGGRMPTLEVAFGCFARLGRQPEELMKAPFALQHSPNFVDADQDLRAITEGVRQSAAGADLARLDELDPLALAVFGYVCRQGGQGVKKLFSAAPLDKYRGELGRPVGAEEIQKVATMLVDSFVNQTRRCNGLYHHSNRRQTKTACGRCRGDRR